MLPTTLRQGEATMTGLLSTISRRAFLAATAGAAVIGAPRILGRAEAAVAGKVLRIASGEADGTKGTLDPAFSAQDDDATRAALVYERLVILDEGFAPRPQLAESWTTNDKGDEWVFKLRQGVRFHDGEPFTARHVVYTYRRLLDPATGSPAKASLSAIDPKGIEAVDDATVRFRLPQPVVQFPAYIANRFTYIVRQGQPPADYRTKGIGTGPFKVKQFTPGEEPSVFVKNESYWQPGLPKVDGVELRSIADGAAQVAAIAAGQIDLTWDLPRVGLARLESNPAVKVVSVRTPYVMSMSMWIDTPPFDDLRVRQALKYTIDRDKVVKLVLGGRGQVADDNPVAPWVQYGLQEPARKRDIAKAKALLAEAGHGNGLDVELHTSEAVIGFIELATLFQAMAQEAGVNVKLVKSPAGEYWDNIWLKKPFVCSAWSGRAADEALSVPYLSNGEWNETHWRRPEYDNLIAEARRTVDDGKRGQLYQQCQRMLRDEGGILIPIFPDAIGATRANVTGWRLHPQKFSKDFSKVEFTS
jgi:peptide/nickel transport system substrate-binding protein